MAPRVHGRRGEDVAASRPGAVEAAAGTRGEEARRQPELDLGVVAVEALDVVVRERPARRASLEVEEPDEPAVAGVDRVEPALAGLGVVHVHAKEDEGPATLVPGDDR
jgi:hypothetical protein